MVEVERTRKREAWLRKGGKERGMEGDGEKVSGGYINPVLNYYHYCNGSVMFSFLDL